MDQRSSEWFAARAGKVTASRVADVVARTKSGYSASRDNYKAQLVCERLTGTVEPSYTNAAMQWGTDNEPAARDCYCFISGHDVAEIGFAEHPSIAWSGCSPDGLIGDVGLVEIKCPNTATHIDTLLKGDVPEKYLKQIGWQLACYPQRAWCDFVSYDPRLPEQMQLFVKRVHRDDALIAELETEVAKFLTEVADTVAQLRERYVQPDESWRTNVLLAG